ncbi:hypothetical protein GN958_ATG23546, partial [Phytophthora infestans]
ASGFEPSASTTLKRTRQWQNETSETTETPYRLLPAVLRVLGLWTGVLLGMADPSPNSPAVAFSKTVQDCQRRNGFARSASRRALLECCEELVRGEHYEQCSENHRKWMSMRLALAATELSFTGSNQCCSTVALVISTWLVWQWCATRRCCLKNVGSRREPTFVNFTVIHPADMS